MKTLLLLGSAAAALGLVSTPVYAQAVVNNTDVGAWFIYGAQTTRIADPAVKGGAAIQATLATQPVNPWDAAAGSNVTTAIHKGDKLHVSVQMKGKSMAGDPTVKLDMVVQSNSAPFGPIGQGKALVLTSNWQTFELDTIADQDYAPNTIALVVHLATGKQVVSLGSPVITDNGQ